MLSVLTLDEGCHGGVGGRPSCDACQTRIGIGAPHIVRAIGLILESKVTVIVDQYQCVKTDVSISKA